MAKIGRRVGEFFYFIFSVFFGCAKLRPVDGLRCAHREPPIGGILGRARAQLAFLRVRTLASPPVGELR